MVSSRFHLELTNSRLVTVLPLTSVERQGWLHRVHVSSGDDWVITEKIRTVSASRFRRQALEIAVSNDELAEGRSVLAQMLLV